MRTTISRAPALAARDMVFDPNVVTVIGTTTIYLLITFAIAASALYILFLLIQLFNRKKTPKECFAIAWYWLLLMPFTWPYHVYFYIRHSRKRKTKQEDVEYGKIEGAKHPSATTLEAGGHTSPVGFTPHRLHPQPVSDNVARVDSLDLTETPPFHYDTVLQPNPSVHPLSVKSTGSAGNQLDHVSVAPALSETLTSRPQSEVQRPFSSWYEVPPPTLCLGERYFEQERNIVGGKNADYFAGGDVGKPVKECLSESEWLKGGRIKSLQAEKVQDPEDNFETVNL